MNIHEKNSPFYEGEYPEHYRDTRTSNRTIVTSHVWAGVAQPVQIRSELYIIISHIDA